MKKGDQKQKDEMLDLVDVEGLVVGKEWRSKVYANGMKNFRLVYVFLKNLNGKIYIMRRTKEKKIGPNLLDIAGEHTHAGETDVDAARRAIQEEYSLDPERLDISFLGYVPPEEGAIGYCSVFLAVTDQEPSIGPEHVAGQWMNKEEIMTIFRRSPHEFMSNVQRHFSKFSRELFG